MYLSDIPSKVAIRFAESAGAGYVRSIPVASQIGTTAGAASFTDGFPPSTFTAISGGGAYVNGEDMNGILQYITAWNRWQGAGGQVYFDAAFCTAIGGYPSRAILASLTVGGRLWMSVVEGNLTDPDGASAAGWTAVGPLAATQAQVTAGTDTSTFVTPATLKPMLAGVASAVASLAEARAGTNNTDIITPLVLAQLFSKSDSQTITLPGGIIIKLGSQALNGNSNTTLTPLAFATPFPNTFGGIVAFPAKPATPGRLQLSIMGNGDFNTAGGTLAADTGNPGYFVDGGNTAFWIAWGT